MSSSFLFAYKRNVRFKTDAFKYVVQDTIRLFKCNLVKIIFVLVSSIVVSSLQVISNCVLPALVLNRQQEVF